MWTGDIKVIFYKGIRNEYGEWIPSPMCLQELCTHTHTHTHTHLSACFELNVFSV